MIKNSYAADRTDSDIQNLIDKIVTAYNPEKIILFGSHAWGKSSADSDIDLLVIKDSHQSHIERERALRSLIYPAGFPVDILVYSSDELNKKIHEEKNLFFKDIIDNGKVLYDKETTIVRYAPTYAQ